MKAQPVFVLKGRTKEVLLPMTGLSDPAALHSVLQDLRAVLAVNPENVVGMLAQSYRLAVACSGTRSVPRRML